MRREFRIEPVAKGRPRFTRSGRTYTPEKTKTFETQIKWEMSVSKAPLITNRALKAKIEFHFTRPKSQKSLHHTVRPDLDNVCKALLDAGNGILWHDDSQFVEIRMSKHYALTDPKIVLEYEPV